MSERIVVVGGSGFIGTRFVSRLLAAGHDVTIADKTPSAGHPALYRACDVRDPAALARAVQGADVVFNLAAEHRDDVQPRSLYDDVNVQGARNLCAALDAAGITRLVFTSSVAVYGFAETERVEDSPLAPFNDYGRTKLEAERVYDAWFARGGGRTLTIVRPTVVFGEGNRGNVYNLVRQLASGLFVMVGPGTNRKSMAYVENVAACLEWSLSHRGGRRLYNYADGPDFDMNALVAVVRASLGRSAKVPVRLPYTVGYGLGRVADVVAAVTRRRLPFSSVRVKKFCANTRIAARRVIDDGFRPPEQLEAALRRWIRAEFETAVRG